MHVVTACVHGGDDVAGDGILLRFLRGVCEPSFFFNRQSIHIRTHHDHRAQAIFKDRDDTVTTDAFSNVKTYRTKFARHAFCGVDLKQRQFWITVKMLEQAYQVIIIVPVDVCVQLTGIGLKKYEKICNELEL